MCGLDVGQCADSNMFPVIHKTVAQAGLAAVHDNSSNRKTLSAASVALTVVGNAPGCKLCGKIGLRQYDMDPKTQLTQKRKIIEYILRIPRHSFRSNKLSLSRLKLNPLPLTQLHALSNFNISNDCLLHFAQN